MRYVRHYMRALARGERCINKVVGGFLCSVSCGRRGRSGCWTCIMQAHRRTALPFYLIGSTDAVVSAVRDTIIFMSLIGLLFRGGPAARGELPNQRGSAGMEAVRLRCAWQSVQAGRSSREARLPGQQSASRHASALWACRLLAGDAGAAGRLRGTGSTCALLATR